MSSYIIPIGIYTNGTETIHVDKWPNKFNHNPKEDISDYSVYYENSDCSVRGTFLDIIKDIAENIDISTLYEDKIKEYGNLKPHSIKEDD